MPLTMVIPLTFNFPRLSLPVPFSANEDAVVGCCLSPQLRLSHMDVDAGLPFFTMALSMLVHGEPFM